MALWAFDSSFPWTPKPWNMKVLHHQNMGYKPKKWRLWVPMVWTFSDTLDELQYVFFAISNLVVGGVDDRTSRRCVR